MPKPTMRLVRHVERETVMYPGWCSEHNDFAWGYTDGSIACFWACTVETGTSDCVFVKGVLELPRGTVRRKGE